MNRLWVWLIAMVAAIGCSKADLPMTPDPVTTLTVTAITADGDSIDSADVFIDGSMAGHTPFNAQDIQPGLHALRVSRSGFLAYTDRLVIDEGRVYAVEAVLEPLPPGEGQLVVSVNRDSVLVQILDANDELVTESFERAFALSLPPGNYTVLGKKNEEIMAEKEVEIITAQTSVVVLDLRDEPGEPPSLSFSILEDTVQVGEAFNLEWQSDGAQVIIDQGIGVRGPTGSEKVVCQTTGMKIFTATAYSVDDLTTQRKDTIHIAPKSEMPPGLSFDVAQDTVDFGEPALLMWESDGLEVVIDRGVGSRGPQGSEEVNFTNPGKKVFTATAYGAESLFTVKKDSVFVREQQMPPHPVVMLSATRRVTVNEPATISWMSKNADHIVIDYVEHPELTGSQVVVFSSPGIRIVTATAFNRTGYISASDTIEVVEPEVNPVDDILLAADVNVRADKGEDDMKHLKAATFEVTTAGKYRLLAEVWYNSGDSQLNESYYLDISDENSVSLPRDPNAGVYKVVPDEPGEPHTSTRDSGTFKLSEGRHDINVFHYALIAEQYPQFINDEIDGPESVKILGFKLVYVGD